MRLLMLRRNDPYRNDLLVRLMGHEEERKNFPEYWSRVRNFLGSFIVTVLNNEKLLNKKQQCDKITLDDVVSCFQYYFTRIEDID